MEEPLFLSDFFFIIIIYGVKRKEKKKQNEHCVYELGTQKSLLNTDCWYIEWCLLCYNFYQIIDSKCSLVLGQDDIVLPVDFAAELNNFLK